MRSPRAKPRLFIETRALGRVTILALAGALTEDTLAALGRSLSKELARIPPYLVLDGRYLHVVDAAGTDLLLSAAEHARSSSGRLVAVGFPSIADLDPAATVDQAMALMRRG
ncbi:STAS domain-containing protein [Nonomuraea sp. NPDC059007]|uniref:STAS domain-containing protein n=1 Tax=Nonomuraea sp. NPDC059007 TaxID=3346692 RepID=UPI00368D9C96